MERARIFQSLYHWSNKQFLSNVIKVETNFIHWFHHHRLIRKGRVKGGTYEKRDNRGSGIKLSNLEGKKKGRQSHANESSIPGMMDMDIDMNSSLQGSGKSEIKRPDRSDQALKTSRSGRNQLIITLSAGKRSKQDNSTQRRVSGSGLTKKKDVLDFQLHNAIDPIIQSPRYGSGLGK